MAGAPVDGIYNTNPNAPYVNGNPAIAQEGSYFPGEALEHTQREILKVITEAGLTPIHTDLTQLWQALQLLYGGEEEEPADFESRLKLLPVYPEITASGFVFTFTASTGQIIVDSGLTWLHRGATAYTTADFLLADRTFATSASKTYHLRWYAPGHAMAPSLTYPKGRLMLRDLADTGGYNPGAAAETSAIFESTYDDMLVARVVTNGSNVLTVTALLNRALLVDEGEVTIGFSTYDGGSTLPSAIVNGVTVTLNWARRPRATMAGFTSVTVVHNTDGAAEQINVGVKTNSRYSLLCYYQRSVSPETGYVRYVAVA